VRTDIIEVLRANADPARAVEMSAYMRDQFPFLGVSAADRKELCREFMKTANKKSIDWPFVFECWQLPEREYQYLASDYLIKVKAGLTPTDIPNLGKLITTKSWWDTTDSLDFLVGDIALRYPEVKGTLLKWSTNDNIWLRRVAIDHQLAWKDKTDVALLEQIILNNLGQDEFFINKAIGWSLREYSKTDQNWVRNFIEKHRHEMKPLSVREGSKYL
jgi:3-methyladenine DNA glycosylase AlkD